MASLLQWEAWDVSAGGHTAVVPKDSRWSLDRNA